MSNYNLKFLVTKRLTELRNDLSVAEAARDFEDALCLDIRINELEWVLEELKKQ